VPVAALDLDVDAVAVLHERRLRLAALDGLDGTLLGDAGVAARPVLVADGARAHDAAGAHVARPGDMRNELAEVEGHFLAGGAQAHTLAVPGRLDIQVHPAAGPGFAQLVGCHRDRTEGGGRLALEEAEALGQFGRDQVAQTPVVDQHQQAHAVQGRLGRRPHADVARDHRDLRLEVDAPVDRTECGLVAGAEEVVAAALVHQRVLVERGGYLGLACTAHQLHVVDEGRTIGPLVGAWQRRHAQARVEGEGMA
jgi:hypothetical protein